MAGSTWSCCHLSASSVYTIHPCTNKALNRPEGIMSDWQDVKIWLHVKNDTSPRPSLYQEIWWNGQQYQHVLALRALLTGVILKGLTLWKFVSNVCVCNNVCFMFVWQLVLWIDLTEGLYIYKKSFEMCIYLWFEFDCPEVTQLLLLLPSLCFSHSWRSEREDTHASVAILWAATSSPTILSLEYRM